jgi:hypothetical protein
MDTEVYNITSNLKQKTIMKNPQRRIHLTLFIILISFSFQANAFVTTICDNYGSAQHPKWSCMTLLNVACIDVSYIEGMTCSEQYFSVPPVISVNSDGKAYLNNKGVITQIASDRVRDFILQKSTASKAERRTSFLKFMETDDGKVSSETIRSLSKELKAKVVRSANPSIQTPAKIDKMKKEVSLNPHNSLTPYHEISNNLNSNITADLNNILVHNGTDVEGCAYPFLKIDFDNYMNSPVESLKAKRIKLV